MAESVVAVAYYEDVNGQQHSRELSPGDRFELDCDLATHAVFEVRPAEDEKIEADGGREITDDGRQFYESLKHREKVIERLESARNCWPMLKAMRGENAWTDLSIVDYIRPLKMTRGSIALHSAEAKGDGYYSMNAERVLVQIQDGPLGITRSADKEARMMLQTAILTETVRPVPIEDTPFVEDHGDE